jgi:hypothetical protein
MPPGTQLGRRERLLLLAAAPHDNPTGAPLVAPPDLKQATAQRRAVATLRGKGLVQATAPGPVRAPVGRGS